MVDLALVSKEEKQRYLVLDYETRSEANLKKVGTYQYAKHPTTQILCACWRIGTRDTLAKVKTHRWKMGDPLNVSLINHLRDPQVMVAAHNAFFEQTITRFVLGVNVPIHRWVCTAALAAASGCPRNLEGVARVLGLAHQKDVKGHKLMLKWCKPRKPSKKDKSLWCHDPEELERIVQYCEADIAAQTELLLRLRSLSPFERRVWELDQKINWRGFKTDRVLIDKCLALIETEVCNLNQETFDLTLGVVDTTKKVAALQSWVSQGVFLPDLRAKTVSDFLASDECVDPTSRRLLEIRQKVSRSSTAKYTKFKERRDKEDGRIRDSLVYHGAGTGRWASFGVQIHNLPKGTIKDPVFHSQIVRQGDLEMIRLLADPMQVFSSILRNVIVAPRNRVLYCADFSSIELRVLFWAARYERGLQMIRDGVDLYKDQATAIYGKPIESIEFIERQLGKKAVLSCGYGAGGKRFHQMCIDDGVKVSEEMAQLAVDAYRSRHELVPQLWKDVERAAIKAVLNPGCAFKAARCTYGMNRSRTALLCKLPSGRLMSYLRPQVRYEVKWNRKTPKLYVYTVNERTNQWNNEAVWGGVLVGHAIQATARDLLTHSLLQVEAGGYEVVLHLHDEIVAERDEGTGSLEEFYELMKRIPSWAMGIPIGVEGWVGKVLHK